MSDIDSPATTQRLFIAITLAESVRLQIASLSDALQKGSKFTGARVSWTSPSTFHLTLRFLGDTPESRIPSLCVALKGIAERHSPFPLKARELGVFPHWGRPRVIWVGMHGKKGEPESLQSEIERIVQRYGFEPENKPYHAHLTLGRIRSSKAIRPLQSIVESHGKFKSDPFTVESFELFSSVLHPDGARHIRLESFKLSQQASADI